MIWPHRGRAILAVCAVAVLLTVTALTALHVALPSLAEAFDADTRRLQWIVDAYAIAFGGLLLTGGALGDRLGRRRALVAGFATTIAAAALAATAPWSGGVAVLIAARLLAGAAAAILLPASLTVLTEAFTGLSRARAIAVWSGVAGAGGAVGPALGGWVLDLFGWGAVFGLSAVLAAIGLVGAAAVVEPGRPEVVDPIDRGGIALSMVAIASTLFVIIEAPALGFEPTVVLAGVVAVTTTLGFVRHEARTTHPMLPLHVLARPRIRRGASTLFFAAIGFNGVIFVSSLLLQLGWGETATMTGLLLLPIGIAEFGLSTRSVSVAERIGTERAIRVGLVAMAVGYLLLAAAGPGERATFVAGAIVAGLGNGLVIPLSVERIVGGDDQSFAGVRAGINETAIELGASVGVAVLGAVQRVLLDGGVSFVAANRLALAAGLVFVLLAFPLQGRTGTELSPAAVVGTRP